MLCGLYPQFGGQITNGGVFLEDQPLEQIVPFERAKRIGMLFQDPDKRFCMATLDQQLTFVLENLQLPADQITAKKQHILQELELTSLKDRQLSTLSGGQNNKRPSPVYWQLKVRSSYSMNPLLTLIRPVKINC